MPDQVSPLAPTDRPELLFALVRPSGCPGEEAIGALRGELLRVGYVVAAEVKLSKLLHTIKGNERLKSSDISEDQRITEHMDAGDDLRKRFQHGGVLAYLAIEEITTRRPPHTPNLAWIIDSLKHRLELEVLRGIYGERLIVISLYADEEERRRLLAKRIASGRVTKGDADARAASLIDRDQKGTEHNQYGQDVRDTFPLADYFVTVSRDVRAQIGRLVETLFGRPTRSPSPDEYAMSVARSVALRSADLSRQVGAVIVDRDGEVLVAGCNEVPRPGGGVYWEGDADDGRDHVLGYDPNDATTREVLSEVLQTLDKRGWIAKSVRSPGIDSLVKRSIEEKVFAKTRAMSLIEFGRIVHAESNAVLRAATIGVAVRGLRMVCTTFPCHMCARNLIGAGISEVVYIEPYPKSLATSLYPNAIAHGEKAVQGKVTFRQFIGWAPQRYGRVFEFSKRKSGSGYLGPWDALQARPKVAEASGAVEEMEHDVVRRTASLLKGCGIARVVSPKRKRLRGNRR